MACKASACSNVCNSVAVRRLREAQWRSLCSNSGYRRLATPATDKAFQAWEQRLRITARGRREAWKRITNFRKILLVWADILFLIQFILEIWLLCQGTRTIYSVLL